MPTSECDVAVVGAGPAGLAAAASALEAGAQVTLIDSSRQPGGQYWRHREGDIGAVADLHHDLGTFRRLIARSSGIRHYRGHHVWTVERHDAGFTIRTVADDVEQNVTARSLVLAPGAYDRQIPFPGWDLPGVYTAGGAQALLKGHEVTVGDRVAVGGTGPFLLPVAAGLAVRGADVVGVFEANSGGGWLRHGPSVAPVAGKLAEAAGYAATLARHRVPYRPRRSIVAAHGTDSVEAVTVARLDPEWRMIPGTHERIACDAVAVGWGFTPQIELPLALGCSTRIDTDGSLIVDVDDNQLTSVSGVYAAGEACGVGGAALAVVEGEIAGRSAAGSTSLPTRHRRRRRALRRFASAMHEVAAVRDGWQTWLADETLVCRCEEVSAGEIRHAVHQFGASDARSVKLLTRAGMGWCQSRVCGFASACLAATESQQPRDLRGVSERPIATPVSLATLARDPK